MGLIADLTTLRRSDVPIAGGKAAWLGEIAHGGFPVPSGFAVLTRAYEQFIEQQGLQGEIDKILSTADLRAPSTLGDAAARLRNIITSAPIPPDLAQEITVALSNIPGDLVAVRSSAVGEDSEHASWAGQLDTFLNVQRDDVVGLVRDCWASLFSRRAIFYRLQRGLGHPGPIAVIVQQMVPSEASGVAFSHHPTRPSEDDLVIEAGKGPGQSVSGETIPDQYVVTRLSSRIVGKTASGRHVSDGFVLEDRTILEVAETVLRLEMLLGFACDVEWATAGGNLYVLQARPITTLAPTLGARAARPEVPVLNKIFARDFTLFSLEIAYQGESRALKPWSDGQPNPHAPYCLFERTDGTVYIWFNHQGVDWVNATLKRRVWEDPGFMEQVRNRVLSGISWIRPIYEQPRPLSRADLLRFTADFLGVYNWLEAMWCLCKVPDEELHATNTLVELRKSTETLSAATDAVIRQSLASLYPELGQLSSMLTLSEFRSGLIPNIETLGVRQSRFIYVNDTVFGGMSLDDARRQFGIEFVEEQLPPGRVSIAGEVAVPGRVEGAVCRVMGHVHFGKIRRGEVLVAPMTMPDFTEEMEKAAAFVTDEGGALCHAAIIAREMNKPCVVGTRFATQLFEDGDIVEVDADNGIVRLLQRAQ